jgi:hypothetical protein
MAAGESGKKRGLFFPEIEVDDAQPGRIADQFHFVGCI